MTQRITSACQNTSAFRIHICYLDNSSPRNFSCQLDISLQKRVYSEASFPLKTIWMGKSSTCPIYLFWGWCTKKRRLNWLIHGKASCCCSRIWEVKPLLDHILFLSRLHVLSQTSSSSGWRLVFLMSLQTDTNTATLSKWLIAISNNNLLVFLLPAQEAEPKLWNFAALQLSLA